MPQRIRVASGEYAYHVLNRAVGRTWIFGKQRDFQAFEEVIREAKERLPMRVLRPVALLDYNNNTPCGKWP